MIQKPDIAKDAIACELVAHEHSFLWKYYL